MKSKILLTSALALTIAYPAMSDPLPAIENCVEDEIGTATGPASLEADWTANVINLTWENNGATTGATGGASTCTYAESFDLPQAPTKTGYNFAGWKVKSGPAQCTAASINNTDKASKGTAYAAKRLNGNGDTTSGGATAATYGISEKGEWGVTLAAGGILKGMARCSTVGSGYRYKDVSHEDVTDNNGTGRYCWCQPTSYTVAGGEMCTVNSSSSWVFGDANGNADSCAYNCADHCALFAQNDAVFRAALFGLAAN